MNTYDEILEIDTTEFEGISAALVSYQAFDDGYLDEAPLALDAFMAADHSTE